jgi:hypothetical protein
MPLEHMLELTFANTVAINQNPFWQLVVVEFSATLRCLINVDLNLR